MAMDDHLGWIGDDKRACFSRNDVERSAAFDLQQLDLSLVHVEREKLTKKLNRIAYQSEMTKGRKK